VNNTDLHQTLADQINTLLDPTASTTSQRKGKSKKSEEPADDDDAMDTDNSSKYAFLSDKEESARCFNDSRFICRPTIPDSMIDSVVNGIMNDQTFVPLFEEPEQTPAGNADQANEDQPFTILPAKQKRIRYIDVGNEKKRTALHLAGTSNNYEYYYIQIIKYNYNRLCP